MRLVIVGDTLLDRDVDGSVTRIAPDAPAPVLDEENVHERPGGAGLAALLAARHGQPVTLVTALAADAAGARLSELLTAAGITVYALPLPGRTPEKIRMRAGGQVLLRLDRGGPPQPPGDAPAAVLEVLREATAILVSDYGRGVAGHPALRAALTEAKAPVVWDPHPNGPSPVPGVRLVTPNESEARRLAGDAGHGSGLSTAQRTGHTLRQRWKAGAVVVTRGSSGAVLCQGGPSPLVVPVPAASGGDTCGAGDAFAVAAAVALAGGALVSEAVEAAVHEASAYVAGLYDMYEISGRREERDRTAPLGQARPRPDGGSAGGRRGDGPAGGRPDGGSAGGRPDGGSAGGRPGDASAGGRLDGGYGGVRPGGGFTGERPGGGNAGGGDGDGYAGSGDAGRLAAAVRARGGTVVATGGCFDLLHTGHLATLRAARSLGDCLVVLLNSDDSVRRLKGADRPLTGQDDRARLLAALDCVDAVVIFGEPTPEPVLTWLRPDIWVKGGDYADGGPDLPESAVVERWGGQTVIVPYLDGRSTTRTIAEARGR
ncbi:PfkB family carbohydrate kinase [Actinoplanes sp. G11-F43]|uniref:PfkB family carbohydrate kinase n=1 Tax=Actinoplanes sp. G11-F43 TaxID=3424130 RepID=UPI003D33792D